jgi:hypothetical protein
MKALRFAALTGTMSGTAAICITLPELLENLGLLTLIGYTLGVVIITSKINTILRGKQ